MALVGTAFALAALEAAAPCAAGRFVLAAFVPAALPLPAAAALRGGRTFPAGGLGLAPVAPAGRGEPALRGGRGLAPAGLLLGLSDITQAPLYAWAAVALGTATDSTMELITSSAVRPSLYVLLFSEMRCARTYGARYLMSSGIT